jgi:hypothetical protein
MSGVQVARRSAAAYLRTHQAYSRCHEQESLEGHSGRGPHASVSWVGYVRYFWVFGTGAKAGELNYMVHKGVLFKTYEGKMIQTGVRSQAGTFQSFEFLFSVSDPNVAEQLMANSGNQFNLHYREYVAALPWRGHSKFVVDSIISMDVVTR